MFTCMLCPNCIYEPQTKCNIYRNMLKQFPEVEIQKPKKNMRRRKRKAQTFDKELLREWATAVKTRDGYVCTICGIDDGRKIHAHHKLSKSRHPESAYDIGNGVTACVSCHSWVHGVDLEKSLVGKTMIHDIMDDYYTSMDEKDYDS